MGIPLIIEGSPLVYLHVGGRRHLIILLLLPFETGTVLLSARGLPLFWDIVHIACSIVVDGHERCPPEHPGVKLGRG